MFPLSGGAPPRHVPRVRVPLYIALPLLAAVVAIVWWRGTLGYDFVSPPSEAALTVVRAEAVREFTPTKPSDSPRRVMADGQIEPDPEVETPPPDTAFDPGDTDTSPGLEAYAVESPEGAPHLIKIATALEAKGSFQRALLAWERVLDMGKAEPDAYTTALASIRRLRPTLPPWTIDADEAIPIVLHVTAGPTTATTLKPVVEGVAHDLAVASQGILRVSVDLAVAKKPANNSNAAAPVTAAMWLSGAAKDAPSTDTLSFTVGKPDALKAQVLTVVYRLVGGQLKHKTAYSRLPEIPLDEEPAEALTSRITRLCWRELGAGLNLPPAAPVPAPVPSPRERDHDAPAPRTPRTNKPDPAPRPTPPSTPRTAPGVRPR